MKMSGGAGASLLGAVILGGCGASAIQAAPVRVHVTTAAFEQHGTTHAQLAERIGQRVRKESPLIRACKTGDSKACVEVGDRLVVKHANMEAQQWYVIACDRVIGSMVPTAARLMQLSREQTQLASPRSDGEADAAGQKRMAALKSEASEIKARVQGCRDAGETLKDDAELKQSLKYFDAACEFSTLVAAVGPAVPGLEYVAEGGCSAGQSARAQLTSQPTYSPQLFVALLQPPAKPAAAKQSVTQNEEGMVFNQGDL